MPLFLRIVSKLISPFGSRHSLRGSSVVIVVVKHTIANIIGYLKELLNPFPLHSGSSGMG